MSNPIVTITHCESCGNVITLESPPSKERYSNAEIQIKDATILLPSNVVKRNHKDGWADSHGANLSGYYCSPACLVAKIESILGKRIKRG